MPVAQDTDSNGINWINRSMILYFLLGFSFSINVQSLPFERTEGRAPCDNYNVNKVPLFGDLHVHSRYSFDSYGSNQRNDPWDAYRYAKGETIMLPNIDGEQAIAAQIHRPLDFTSVTDHGETLGQIGVCSQNAGRLGYWWPMCIGTRSKNYYVQLGSLSLWAINNVSREGEKKETFACKLSDCKAAGLELWSNIQQAAEDHYDRSSECKFTTFVGYEYTDAPDTKNMHRNVIFRNENVTDYPITTFDTGSYNFPNLWTQLQSQCIDPDQGCDVIAIPHNPNLAGGLMFPNPATPQQAQDRLQFEPIVELLQHKAASECRFDRLAGRGVLTEDELCDFEQTPADNLSMLGSVHGEIQSERGEAVALDDFAPRNMVRNALKAGLELEQSSGTNPFKMGFIGSTDTHNALPGGAEEDNYPGHLGMRDTEYRNVQDHLYSNPGGLAVVWAEENSRDSIFNGMRNKETYATSGTRPSLRFFAGWDYSQTLCQAPDMLKQAYADGVPMGGDLFGSKENQRSPQFLVAAQKDPFPENSTATDIQRIQIIKGWIDSQGQSHEKVYDVAGNANNGASVNLSSCAAEGAGLKNACTVWQDPNFNPSEDAFYYVRLIENPSCRWSTLQCKAAGVDPFSENCATQAAEKTATLHKNGARGAIYEKCCTDPAKESFYSPIIQERAWSSPIWYTH
tara:strand:+ start:2827 stop:4872 length:2046 start_codon:yes stop_codon:yes gene_type:complete